MTRFKLLVLLTVAVLSLSVLALASAQKAPPHVFLGTVTGGDGPVQDGTIIGAVVDGEQVVSVVVSGGSYLNLVIEPPEGASYAGKVVSFTIGGMAAAETATWVQGEGTILNLTLPAVVVEPTFTPQPESTSQPVTLLSQKGDKGEKGERGDIGTKGDTGEKGDEGDRGPTGSQGRPGPAGAAGPPGQSGQPGPSGPAGPAGPAGSSGPAGVQGAIGISGEDGSSGGSTIAILALIFSLLAVVLAGGRIAWHWIQWH